MIVCQNTENVGLCLMMRGCYTLDNSVNMAAILAHSGIELLTSAQRSEHPKWRRAARAVYEGAYQGAPL